MGLSQIVPQLNMMNTLQPQENLLVGGQPTAADLQRMKQAGVSCVINLRPASEKADFDEAALVEELGMHYVNIPVASPADLHQANVKALAQALPEQEKCLVHCASGNRVGALLALMRHQVDGEDAEKALQFGLSAGLTKLAPVVENLLNQPQA